MKIIPLVAAALLLAALLLKGCAIVVISQGDESTIAVDVLLDKEIEVDATVGEITGAKVRRTR